MTTNIINRSYVSAPLLKSLLASPITNEQLAAKMATSKTYLQSIILGDRDASIDRYQEIANRVGMELSLVPKHLARSAVLETGTNADLNDQGLSSDEWTTDLMVTLRDHRLRNGATLEQVSEVLGNSMPSFTKFQNAEPVSTLPSIQTVQRYADMFNLVLVAVGKNSTFARHAKADFARDVSYKVPKNELTDAGRDNVDRVLGELLTKVKHDPAAFTDRYKTLADAAQMLSKLEPVQTERPSIVRMPPKFAAAVKKKMEAAANRGVEKVPYAQVIKPWGNPKSWAQYASREAFDQFYTAIAHFGVRHESAEIARTSELLLKTKPDLPISKLIDFLGKSQIALCGEARLPDGKRVTFVIREAAEMSLVMEKLIGDRPITPISKETSLSKQSIESLIAHPEDNRMSTVFRLMQHFGVRFGAVNDGMVLQAEKKAKVYNTDPNRAFGNIRVGKGF